MKTKHLFIVFSLLITGHYGFAQAKLFKVHTVAFYNLENLFDTIKDPNINDDEYLPSRGWTSKKYRKKLQNLDRVIPEIGVNEQQPNAPTIIGVCEVENRGVLEDLVKMPGIAKHDYGIVHFDSPDGRGIDVGFLYQKKHFTPTSYSNIPLRVKRIDDPERWLRSRDQLLVSGYLDGEEMHFIINHWPSRSGGEKRSSPYREAAGALNKRIIDSLQQINPNAKVMTMGDLNDGPYNKSVKKELGAQRRKEDTKPQGMFNPFEEMSKRGEGTLAYRDSWDLFDQIIISGAFLDTNDKDYSTYKYWKSGIHKKQYLIQQEGQYKGYPLRNTNAEPGFSDHFPVYIYLIKEHKQ